MLVYPENFEEKIDVTRVREIIATFCHCEASVQFVYAAKPLTDFKKLMEILDQTGDCIRLIHDVRVKLPADFQDITLLIKRIRTSGTFLEGDDFLDLKAGLAYIEAWYKILSQQQHIYPHLYNVIEKYKGNQLLIDQIDRTIDERGIVRDNASVDLQQIRREMIRAEQQVRKTIRQILEKSKKEGYSDEENEVTIREGRLVIPVKAEFKRQIAGFVHDESSTGQTVFMEPAEVLALNNEVKSWQFKEKRELQRILTELTDRIRESLEQVEIAARCLILLDFIVAKARFAVDYQGVIPNVQKGAGLNLINGRHALLQKIHQQQGKKVVPLSITLTHDQDRMVIISGPNAGGKSVAMKTVGLLQYMFQCGFPVTADDHSVFGIFTGFFLDIGDEQSLDNDLSTYSSRLKAMKYFLDMAENRSLVLIDEFGTGTEPQFGGAIAQAILTKLSDQRVYGVITTHYSNIKEMAEKTPAMVNAAMRYDTANLRPLYQLEIGKPGSSFAFEIARKSGISEAILNSAAQLVGDSRVDYDKLLSALEADKAKFDQLNQSLEAKSSDLKKLRDDYEALKKMLSEEKKQIIKGAKIEAQQIVAEANKRIEKAIRDIKESQADKIKTKAVREELKSLGIKYDAKPTEKRNPDPQAIATGDMVRLIGQEGIGEVIDLKGKQAQVSFGLLKSFVATDRLEKVSRKEQRNVVKTSTRGVNLAEKRSQFSSELDLRGMRAEEVVPLLDKFMDDALMLGVADFRVLHGKGYGVLREIVRNHLSGYKQVDKLADEHVERGGSGITVVNLTV